MDKEEIKQVFLDNIEDNYTINLAIALAEEWEEYKNKINNALTYIRETRLPMSMANDLLNILRDDKE